MADKDYTLKLTMEPDPRVVSKRIYNKYHNIFEAAMNQHIRDIANQVVSECVNTWDDKGFEYNLMNGFNVELERDQDDYASIVVVNRTPYAKLTDKWPRKRIVRIDDKPKLRRWISVKGVEDKIINNKYFAVYTPGGAVHRVPQGWWQRAQDKAREIVGPENFYEIIDKLIKEYEEDVGMTAASAAAKLGWITRRERARGISSPGRHLSTHGGEVGWNG